MLVSTPNRFRHALEKLAAEAPSTKTALIRSLLSEIEAALASGKTWKQSGNASPTMASTSVTKRFANSFNVSGRKRAYPRRQGGKPSNFLACMLKKQRMA
jgi:hypothetical protein